jgi:hypothetical protein
MKITKRQFRRIIKEESALIEAYNSMSSSGKAIANSIKGKFMRMYPDAKVGIDGRGGFITVNGKKAVDMSQATGRGMTDEEMIEKMHSVYAGKQVDDDVGTEARRGSRPGEHKLDFGKDIGTYNYRSEGANMKITKRQLRRIIKEEMARVTQMHPSTTRVASTTEGELKVWLRLVGPENIEKALKGKNDLTEELIAALREYDANRR